MKNLICISPLIVLISSCKQKEPQKNDYPIQTVSPQNVELNDNFWSKHIATNRDVTIPYCIEKCEETHRIANFEVAGGLIYSTFEGGSTIPMFTKLWKEQRCQTMPSMKSVPPLPMFSGTNECF